MPWNIWIKILLFHVGVSTPYDFIQPSVNSNLHRFQISKQLGDPALSWRQISYNLTQNVGQTLFLSSGSTITQQGAGTNEEIVSYNNVPMGVSRWRKRLFITVPRRAVGIPATLNVLDLSRKNLALNTDLPLTPYPDLQTNRFEGRQLGPSSLQLVSVYRTTVDECNRLWMVDTGFLEYRGNQRRVQPASIVVFDLLMNQLSHRYELPSSVVTNATNLAAITIDIPNIQTCQNAFAYMPDVAGYGIIVYNLREQRSWRFSHNYFHQDPLGGIFQINQLRFEWDDGIFSIALGTRSRHGFRNAYFHAMASTHEFAVNTRVLRNESYASISYMADVYTYVGDKGARQNTAMSILDQETGVLFFSQVQIGGLACWNTNLPFSAENFVVLFEDNQRFIYPSDLTLDYDGNLWVMTNSLPYFIYSRLNPRNVNFRIWRFNVKQLISNTKCDIS